MKTLHETIIHEHFTEGLSYGEIAARHGISRSRVAGIVYRCRGSRDLPASHPSHGLNGKDRRGEKRPLTSRASWQPVEVRRLAALGWPVSVIARRFNADRKTIDKILEQA